MPVFLFCRYARDVLKDTQRECAFFEHAYMEVVQ
jgi:hypothetical protein